jgi:glycosyltransferase involved in cell wall biosynthesis
MKIAVVIPCFNEQDNIENFLNSLKKIKNEHDFEVTPIVVNDCSNDNTALILEKTDGIVFLDLPINLGIGGAVQTGYRYALENDFDAAVQMDGDGQHPATELYKLVAEFEKGEADVVIGSRFLENEGFQSTQLRRLGINYFSFILTKILKQTITDPTSGFRLLGKKAMQVVKNYYPDQYPEPEILVYYHHNRLIVKEVPVVMIERLGGVSSINSWKSIYYMFKVSLGIFFAHWRFLFKKQ